MLLLRGGRVGVVAGVFVVMSVVLLSDSRAGPPERDREMFQVL